VNSASHGARPPSLSLTPPPTSPSPRRSLHPSISPPDLLRLCTTTHDLRLPSLPLLSFKLQNYPPTPIIRFLPLYSPHFCLLTLTYYPPPRFPWLISSSIVTRVPLSTSLLPQLSPNLSFLARYGQLASSSTGGWRCRKDCSGSTSMSGLQSLAPMCLFTDVHSPSSL
jgi:hypothetical protein